MARTRTAAAKVSGKTAKPVQATRSYGTLEVEIRNAVALIALARPDVHNAFDETLISELTHALEVVGADTAVRAVVLHGRGKSFCAGADLNWMKRMASYGEAENLADANALAAMLRTLYLMPKPTIARVHGAAYGGGSGLVACCDIALATSDTTFAFSEAKLGLIPATIGPYVVEAIGPRAAKRYFLSGERFTAAEAVRIGLVHEVVAAETIDQRINEVLGVLLLAGPHAQDEVKALLRSIAHRPIDEVVIADTAARIARVRASPEAKEGVAAFLAKRRPVWVPVPLDDA
jgi:methylglutaconyl-CoA hydratase